MPEIPPAFDELVAGLSEPTAYPVPAARIEVRHTHISVVFLAGDVVYKVKKPVELGFVDFSTLERRRHFCDEEVRLNRRLAPAVYLGVVPITQAVDGLKVEGEGAAVEWAVKMQRLPEECTLRARLHAGTIDAATITTLAEKIASFHRDAKRDPHMAEFGRFESVARNARENLEAARTQLGATLEAEVQERLQTLFEECLQRQHGLIDARAEGGLIRDTHGDMHLSHVYLFPERTPPDDLVIIDCIEFSERFRFADPVADAAFLYMDLKFHGRRELAEIFARAYFAASGDEEAKALLPFYSAYRAAVRAKVEGIQCSDEEVPTEERNISLEKARAHWLIALGELEEAGKKPALVMMGGLPGTGKSTLARAVAEQANFQVIRSDVVRKELAGLDPHTRTEGDFKEGIYSSDWTERTYAECLRRAEECVRRGGRAWIDATFREVEKRRAFLDAAHAWGVPGALLLCQADVDVVRTRLAQRSGDVSDADWSVYAEAARSWTDGPAELQRQAHAIDTSGSVASATAQVLHVLRERQLIAPV